MVEWFVSSAVLAAVLIGAHYLLRGKISARLQYTLWLVLLVRLLLPLSVGKTAVSVANLLPGAEPAAVIQPEPAAAPPAQAASTPEPSAPAAPVQTPTQPVQRPASAPAQTETASAEPEKPAQKPAVSVRKIFLFVWASGAALLGLWFLFCNLRYGRQLRAGVLRAIAPKEGRPAVRLTQTALSPCLFGLFPPAIYVTMDCAQDEQLLHHCAEHEYTHYLHRDHIWAVLRGVCLALHWFNPLVWWAAALSRTDAELFCDEDTVHRLGEDARVDYGRSLIRMTCRERIDPLSAATTMSGRGGQLKTRIISITKHPKTAIPVLIFVLLLCAAAVGCTMTGAKDTAPAQQTQQTSEKMEDTPEEPEPTEDTREEPETAAEVTTTQDTDPAADAAWFAAREPVEQWPELAVNGTSIYDLTLDDIQNVYGTYERILHWVYIQTDYYDVVEFADSSQAAGWMHEDGAIHHPNAAYLRLDAGVEVCGVRFGEDYREAANRFPRDAEPVFEQFDEHTARLMLGGEVMYMGKYSCIAYTDGVPTMLVVCDETAMTFHIENGVIVAVSWMAPEESMQLPIAEQRMTIDPGLLTNDNLKSILIGPEIALVNDGFTFDSPANLTSEQLFMLFLLWSADSTRDNYIQADGKYHFTQDFINGILSQHFRTGCFLFDITQCGHYDASDGTAVIENVSGFGGDRDLRIADVQVLEGSTVQVTADFYNADPFMNGSGSELRYARKVYMLEFYSTGVLFHSARFMPLSEDDLRAALQLHTGETTDDLTQLFWTYDGQNGNLLGSLPAGDWTALPLTEDAWDGLSLFVYERYARENGWPLTIRAAEFRNTLARYFPLGRYGWEDRSSHYLTYQDDVYARTVYDDGHGTRYCYLKRVSCAADSSFVLTFDCLDVPELTEYADAGTDVRAVYDHAGAAELQPAAFRAAVYRAFADGVIPTGNGMTELTVTVRLTGDALQPFYFLSASDA